MKTLINITSYNRKPMLLKLLSQLKNQDIIIWDDNSDFNLTGDFEFRKFNKNYGKILAWRKFNIIFQELNFKDYDYFIFIPDDVILCKNFVNKAIELYKNIDDKNKICLSLLSDDRIKDPCWTNTQPEIKGDVILTQWSDLCFISDGRFFEVIESVQVPLDRWNVEPTLGSGVGSKISRQLLRDGYNQYHVTKTLCTHVGSISKMNNYTKQQQKDRLTRLN